MKLLPLVMLLWPTVYAQDVKKEGSDVMLYAHVGIVAVGPKPSPRYVFPNTKIGNEIRKRLADEMKMHTDQLVKDGVYISKKELAQLSGNAIMLSPNIHQVPPPLLVTDGEEGESSRIRVGYHSNPVFRKVPAGRPLILKRHVKPGSAKLAKYMTLEALMPSSRVLVLMVPPDKPPLLWKSEPKHLKYINLDGPRMVGKNLIIVNTTTEQLNFKLGSKYVELGGWSSSAIQLEHKKAGVLRFTVDSPKLHAGVVARGNVLVDLKNLNLFVIYDANPRTNAGKRIGVYKSVVPLPKVVTKDKR